jgi:hypothetical protein
MKNKFCLNFQLSLEDDILGNFSLKIVRFTTLKYQNTILSKRFKIDQFQWEEQAPYYMFVDL